MASRTLAFSLRRRLLVLAILCWVVAACVTIFQSALEGVVVFAPFPTAPFTLIFWLEDRIGDGAGFVIWCSLVLGSLLFAQWMFLRPRAHTPLRLIEHGRPLKSAVVAAALIATVISAGFVFTVLEIAGAFDGEGPSAWLELPMLGAWAFWTVLFYARWRGGDRWDQLRRMTRRLLAGSVLELLVAIPADVVAAKRESCVCARGSYLGIVLGGMALLWSFGPGIVLLFWSEKVEREQRRAAERAPAQLSGAGSP